MDQKIDLSERVLKGTSCCLLVDGAEIRVIEVVPLVTSSRLRDEDGTQGVIRNVCLMGLWKAIKVEGSL